MSSRLARALRRWQRAAGPYWSFVCAAPFLAQRMPRLPRPLSLGADSSLVLPDECQQVEGLALFFDLPSIPTLRATGSLVELGLYVVPVVQRWPSRSELLPTAELLHTLERASRVVALRAQPRGVAFVLDGERQGPIDPATGQPTTVDLHRFDNRYRYSPDRFPSPATLRALGIQNVIWVSANGVAADLQPYALELAGADLRPVTVEPLFLRS